MNTEALSEMSINPTQFPCTNEGIATPERHSCGPYIVAQDHNFDLLYKQRLSSPQNREVFHNVRLCQDILYNRISIH